MKFFGLVPALFAAFALVQAQNNQSICDKYTTALLKENNATNQLTVLTLVVNTALIGNYSNATGPAKNAVTGILNPGKFNNVNVDLLKYFNGSLLSSQVNGQPASVNFLDGGGAAPLKQNKAANDMTSKQYTLVTHLYQIFGTLLGCSQQGPNSAFMSYQGDPSMSRVHRYMNLDPNEMGYFIQQVGLSATSFGVSMEDATAVGTALNNTFNYRCLPPMSLGSGLPNASQSTCLAAECPTKTADANCTNSGDSFGNGTSNVDPKVASSSSGGSGSSGSGSGGNTASSLLINAVGVLALAAAGAVAVSL